MNTGGTWTNERQSHNERLAQVFGFYLRGNSDGCAVAATAAGGW